jgi:hypothetical protein
MPEGIVWYQGTSDRPRYKTQRQGGQKLPMFIASPIPRPRAHPGSGSCLRNGPTSSRYADLSALQGAPEMAGTLVIRRAFGQ